MSALAMTPLSLGRSNLVVIVDSRDRFDVQPPAQRLEDIHQTPPVSSSEPRFEPELFRTGLKVRSQVRHGPWTEPPDRFGVRGYPEPVRTRPNLFELIFCRPATSTIACAQKRIMVLPVISEIAATTLRQEIDSVNHQFIPPDILATVWPPQETQTNTVAPHNPRLAGLLNFPATLPLPSTSSPLVQSTIQGCSHMDLPENSQPTSMPLRTVHALHAPPPIVEHTASPFHLVLGRSNCQRLFQHVTCIGMSFRTNVSHLPLSENSFPPPGLNFVVQHYNCLLLKMFEAFEL
ncbi:hypothetical protein DEU56DRAFT_900989 [Suillus clintonianus]|uniref:uncharacterized protein n=1 Tax=Suillus clintonianus TaxID=1904413 RepID=UPI001B8613D3|nr:uncharacterized protein DEU56DRAFT_900989 [Suillus clintonianus]KAG2139655.1 hypothetical protein DEU56DRAFT_900989 [Suillus clintonianus]